MTDTATIPALWDVAIDARCAGATTSHTLDAIAWTAAAHATNHHPDRTWDDLLTEATSHTMGAAAAIVQEEADTFGYDPDDGFTYDDLPDVPAGHAIYHAIAAAMLWSYPIHCAC